jgi:hypothetical protein
MLGIFLFLVALVSTTFFTIISIIVSVISYLVRLKFYGAYKSIGKYFYQMALSIDQFANVSLQHIFNRIMVQHKRYYHAFGNEDDTVSYVIARNYNRGTLSKFGEFWAWFLNTVDKNHLQKAVKNKIKSDGKAFKRILNNNYYE